ncbi:thioredoxin domain-containing protein [Stieleria sp. TO1_6]|uniref:thioredoxin family protein n=1 Tax=Stieleria tagensis TaxID=2956795 RepID=UPI00209AC254|nr:thioredoxin domain-containing protein [Stieleria tagensis]MCO8123272.1 thioredoxin domain-containing protein [Stieleria tagensis]
MKNSTLMTLLVVGCLCLVVLSINRGVIPGGLMGEPASIEDLDQRLFKADGSFDLPDGLVLMKFGATWCPPCRKIDHEFQTLKRWNVPMEIQKVDVDQDPELAAQYQVNSIPRLILFQDGRKVADAVGFQSAKQLTEWLHDATSPPLTGG